VASPLGVVRRLKSCFLIKDMSLDHDGLWAPTSHRIRTRGPCRSTRAALQPSLGKQIDIYAGRPSRVRSARSEHAVSRRTCTGRPFDLITAWVRSQSAVHVERIVGTRTFPAQPPNL
jgi:hypothetical protein